MAAFVGMSGRIAGVRLRYSSAGHEDEARRTREARQRAEAKSKAVAEARAQYDEAKARAAERARREAAAKLPSSSPKAGLMAKVKGAVGRLFGRRGQ